MRSLPETPDTTVLRTDFRDSAAWDHVCAAASRPVGEFRASVHFVSDPQYEGAAVEQLIKLKPEPYEHPILFVVDRETLTHPEQPVLVIDLCDQPGRTFRVIPSEMWAVENNLSLANMDFHEFADSVDLDGVFRRFPEP